MDKLNQLSLGEKLIVAGGVLMLIVSILPWYHVSFGVAGIASVSVSRNGWESPGAIWSVLAILVSVVLAGSIIAVKFGNVALPNLGTVTWGQAYLAGGGLVVLLLVIKFINQSSYLSFGFYIGFISALAIAAGGWLLYSEEKTGVVRR